MFNKTLLSTLVVLGLGSGAALAEGTAHAIHDEAFSFEGPLGRYDEPQLQRGLQVFTEMCLSCHGLQYVAYRNLADEGGPGLTIDEMKAYAAQFEVFDPELADGEGDYRSAKQTDYFPVIFDPNLTAPDLSLMAKGRAAFHGPEGTGINQLIRGIGGPEYIVAILTGFADAPSCAPDGFAGNYNTAFSSGGMPDECKDEEGNATVPGSWIAMPQPLWGDDVEYADGHPADLHHEAMDVASFLMWTAEPKMMQRKSAGLVAVGFLSLLAILLFLTNKKLWAGVKRKQFGGVSGKPHPDQGDPIP